ncbi:MAG: hypothetical protein HOQ26_05145, partial [Gemmatimonadaceae bacterium]|nr:hypothetical protein [Gemmatimonadaceae bacterium]NUQ92286.1 hypothetical protein [Gemmatimonadaceae bacterium]
SGSRGATTGGAGGRATGSSDASLASLTGIGGSGGSGETGDSGGATLRAALASASACAESVLTSEMRTFTC